MTIVGVTGLAYRRPEPACVLSNRIYVLAECGEAPFANEIYIDATHQEREFVEEMIGAGMAAVHRLVECHQDRCVIRAGRCQLRVGLTGLGPGLRLGLVLAIRVQGLSLWRGRP